MSALGHSQQVQRALKSIDVRFAPKAIVKRAICRTAAISEDQHRGRNAGGAQEARIGRLELRGLHTAFAIQASCFHVRNQMSSTLRYLHW
jgi:hypothetical protein